MRTPARSSCLSTGRPPASCCLASPISSTATPRSRRPRERRRDAPVGEEVGLHLDGVARGRDALRDHAGHVVAGREVRLDASRARGDVGGGARGLRREAAVAAASREREGGEGRLHAARCITAAKKPSVS